MSQQFTDESLSREESVPQAPVECLGMMFENDEARRVYFLAKLREGLEELHTKLSGVPFTTVEDAVARTQSIEKWPMGNEIRVREIAERMRHAAAGKDLLQRWKDEVGFPHGEIEDVIRLSDPPYYTSCPNPFIANFIKHYGKLYNRDYDDYSREPFAADVSEGKNDPIYNAHSYHTKVPHKAIMRYILHYTEPGEIVFDGFCGTGMTGVAAQLCGDKKTVESLGYKVSDDGTILDEEGRPFSRLGSRHAILNDLSPAATFIAYNYNTPVDLTTFEYQAKRILKDVEGECGWMYLTLHQPTPEQIKKAIALLELSGLELATRNHGLLFGHINYTVWSDVFVCPECAGEVVFWNAAVDKRVGRVHDEFPCLYCNAILTKRNMDRAWVIKFDAALNQTIRQAKQVPVLINYTVGKKRFEKMADAFDISLIEMIETTDVPYWFPIDRMPEGEESRRNDDLGISHVHHFYTKRNLWAVAALHARAENPLIRCALHGGYTVGLKTARFLPLRWINKDTGPMKPHTAGTLYVPSLNGEQNWFNIFTSRVQSTLRAQRGLRRDNALPIMGAASSSASMSSGLQVDYLFIDPPFGGNLMYSELNFIWESWLKVYTNNQPEAIENNVQGKGLLEYQELMTRCFQEHYRALKPNRWMTVEFHNSKNSVWNAIQEALQSAGFVIADVRTLDKKQGSFKQVTSGGAVKQDLIISAYKPNRGLEERFKLDAGTEEGVWDFIRTHLRQLPVFVSKDRQGEVIAERQNTLLLDRMLAFHVQRGVTVPLSATEFYAGLARRFSERDGMYFLPEHVAEYDQKRMSVKEILQLELLITDEASAIQWLKQRLTKKPQTFQELHPQFLRELGAWQKHEKPLELYELLDESFLRYDGRGRIPEQIWSWMQKSVTLRERMRGQDHEPADASIRAYAKDRWYVPDPNKTQDLEKLRERNLLREFEEYQAFKGRQLKVFRLEAVRTGFKKAWAERDYQTILNVSGKLPEQMLHEDPKLLMWYDQALTRTGGET
jgi:DNA modification methylase